MKRREKIIPLEDGWLSLTVDHPDGVFSQATIICHGLTGDKIGPQRLLSELSMKIATAGFLSVRFDFRGSGTSSGNFQDTSFESMQRDLNSVIEWTEANYTINNYILSGISTGALIPLILPEKSEKIRQLILLSNGIPDDIHYDIPQVVKTVSIREGQFYIPLSFFSKRMTLKPRSYIDSEKHILDLICGKKDTKVYREIDSLGQLGTQCHIVDDAGHLFETISARTQLIDFFLKAAKRSFGCE